MAARLIGVEGLFALRNESAPQMHGKAWIAIGAAGGTYAEGKEVVTSA